VYAHNLENKGERDMFQVSETAKKIIKDHFLESGIDASVRIFLSQGG
jgi:hypothetical protein